jgi:alpha-N-acetylglucosaminidase
MSWINGQSALQKKILERARALNMKPVLPAFAGHVPKALKNKFPNAKITSLE